MKQCELFSLFYYVPHVLDLDTGRVYCVGVQDEAIRGIENKRELPRYSKAPVYQRYLKMVQEHLGIVAWEGIDQLPEFELLPNNNPDGIEDFLGHVDDFCSRFDYFLISYRGNPESKYGSFPTSVEYLRAFSQQFTKEWCEKEGYDWKKWVED